VTESPNAATLALYRRMGYLVAHTETHSPYPKPHGRTHDLLGIFDHLAIMRDPQAGAVCIPKVIGLQSTSMSNVSSRVKKIRSSPYYVEWLGTGAEIHVIGWDSRGQYHRVSLTVATHPPIVDHVEEVGL
jgi:hypothetical protein